jgi:hypothetical protein
MTYDTWPKVTQGSYCALPVYSGIHLGSEQAVHLQENG